MENERWERKKKLDYLTENSNTRDKTWTELSEKKKYLTENRKYLTTETFDRKKKTSDIWQIRTWDNSEKKKNLETLDRKKNLRYLTEKRKIWQKKNSDAWPKLTNK